VGTALRKLEDLKVPSRRAFVHPRGCALHSSGDGGEQPFHTPLSSPAQAGDPVFQSR
jgi:hypothetical protein